MTLKTVVSVFSGCGGMDLGFIKAGFEVIWANDFDRAAVASYRRNIGHHIHHGDISLIDSSDLPGADLVIGGFPCQGFSNAGFRRPDDPRNRLFWEMFRVIEAVRPRLFVAENVEGILSSRTPDGRAVMDVIRGAAARLGYQHFGWRKLNAADYGTAQLRKRIIIIGALRPEDIIFPSPTNEKSSKTKPWVTLREVIGDLEILDPKVPNHTTDESANSDLDRRIAAHIPEGGKLCNVRRSPRSVYTWDVAEVFGSTTEEERQLLSVLAYHRRRKEHKKYAGLSDGNPLPIALLAQLLFWPEAKTATVVSDLTQKAYLVEKRPGCFDLRHNFNGLYRRLSWNAPSEAVITGFNRSRLYLHPSQNRPLSVRECLRIQGFPDAFVLDGPVKAQYTQVGNAVPVPFAYAIAQAIRENSPRSVVKRSLEHTMIFANPCRSE